MNDASGLVSLKFAVAVAMGTMIFTVGGATVEFMKVAIGGILAGFVVSWLYGRRCDSSAAGAVMNPRRRSSCCSCCHSLLI